MIRRTLTHPVILSFILTTSLTAIFLILLYLQLIAVVAVLFAFLLFWYGVYISIKYW